MLISYLFLGIYTGFNDGSLLNPSYFLRCQGDVYMDVVNFCASIRPQLKYTIFGMASASGLEFMSCEQSIRKRNESVDSIGCTGPNVNLIR